MDTPPYTPPATEYPFVDSLHIHYCDFAYEEKGPFRMPVPDIGETTAKTFAELLSGNLMDICVGKQKRHWLLHRNILVYHSTWFQKQIEEGNKQNFGKVELLDDDPRAFELLVKWLYQGKIDEVSDMPMDKKWYYADACQQLYVLCEKLNLPLVKNQAIDQFRKGCFEAGLVPGPEEMKPIYDRTPPSSPFRKLVSRIAARQIMDPESQSDASKYRQCFEASADFAIDVINAIKEGSGGKLFHDPTEEDGCYYHEHLPGQSCNSGLYKMKG
ncbi:hypothetical protein ABVK25_008464 [Lepraria finkii]|uniref:BTB domain-containing protein n=1 Tax=Lepraria finkii TaxID=1340010 RepID=A0ABR4B2L5_9LECA